MAVTGELRAEAVAITVPDREAIRAELEATRDAFHAILDRMSDSDWDHPSGIPQWTVGHILVHITTYPITIIPNGVAAARKGKAWAVLPPFVLRTPLPDWINTIATRAMARRLQRDTLRTKYDAAHANLLELLESIQDDEWAKTTYLREGELTIEELFRVHASHFDEHVQDLERVLS